MPLRVGGDVIGTLNVGRMGEAEAHFSANEFELVKLFAGQASTPSRRRRRSTRRPCAPSATP